MHGIVLQKQTKGAKDNLPYPSLFVTFAAFCSRISWWRRFRISRRSLTEKGWLTSPGTQNTSPVWKVGKLVVGLMLLPICVGTADAVWRMLCLSGRADTTWVPLVAGAVCWGVVYVLLPRPMWMYVAGHELTHAVWTWLFVLIALAPYFFPFYAVVVMGVFMIARLVMPWDRLQVWFLLLLGAAYAFHITLTGHVLKTHQSDISEHGLVFSASVILLGNLLVLVLAIPLLVSHPNLPTAFLWCWEGTTRLVGRVGAWLQ